MAKTSIALAMACFLAAGVALGFGLTFVKSKIDMGSHEQAVLLEAVSLHEALDAAGSAARSYAAEHNALYVQHLVSADAAARQQVKSLEADARDIPEAAAALRTLAPLVDQRLRGLYAVMEASPEHVQQSEAERTRALRRLDAGLEQLRAGVQANLRVRQGKADRNLWISMGLVALAALLGPLFILTGGHLWRQQRTAQQARDLQKELMQLQRYAVMGETVAMLAHEVSHPLTAAGNYLTALRRNVSAEQMEPAAVLGMSEKAAQQVERAAVIVHRLRRFIEKREIECSLEEPSTLIDDAVTLMGALDNSVELKTEIWPGLPRIEIDRVQIQQVLVNLAHNALEAMANSPQKQLKLSVRAASRDTILFSVADTGCGLPPQIAPHLFQPFVTTKKDGMGVGLSICRAIIEGHHGAIWAEASPGGGTVFQFILPAAEEEAVVEQAEAG